MDYILLNVFIGMLFFCRVDGEKSPEKEAQAAADGEQAAALEGIVTGSICGYNYEMLIFLFPSFKKYLIMKL